MEDLQIDLELESQEMKELSDLLTETPAAISEQASPIIPTTAATSSSTAIEAINQKIDYKQFLTRQEEVVLRDLTLAMKNIGIPLTLGNGIIHDYIQIANLKEHHKAMILEALSKNRELGYIQDLNNYFRPTGRPNMKRKLGGSNKLEKLDKLPRLDH